MDVQIISAEGRVRALFDEWGALHFRAGRCLFTDPAFFAAWWDTLGRGGKRALHVTVGRSQGRLVALAPLVVTRRYGLRFLEWAGANVFDYGDTLLDEHADRELFWRAIRGSRRYDVALMRGVHAGLDCHDALARLGHPARRSTIHRLDIAWASGEAWMAEGLSRSRRQLLRRRRRQIERRGALGFRVHRSGPVPPAVLDALVQQKAAWASRRGERGLFDDPPGAASLLRRLAEAASRSGGLHLSWLCCGDEIIAVHLGFVHRNVLHYYMPSYDVGWSQHSPGSVLVSQLVVWCIENGVGALDFMRGEHAYKSAYANARMELTDFSFPGSLAGRLAEWALRNVYLRGREG